MKEIFLKKNDVNEMDNDNLGALVFEQLREENALEVEQMKHTNFILTNSRDLRIPTIHLLYFHFVVYFWQQLI